MDFVIIFEIIRTLALFPGLNRHGNINCWTKKTHGVTLYGEKNESYKQKAAQLCKTAKKKKTRATSKNPRNVQNCLILAIKTDRTSFASPLNPMPNPDNLSLAMSIHAESSKRTRLLKIGRLFAAVFVPAA